MAATADWKRALDIPAPAELVRADWARRNSELEAALRDGPPPDYLRHPSVAFRCSSASTTPSASWPT